MLIFLYLMLASNMPIRVTKPIAPTSVPLKIRMPFFVIVELTCATIIFTFPLNVLVAYPPTSAYTIRMSRLWHLAPCRDVVSRGLILCVCYFMDFHSVISCVSEVSPFVVGIRWVANNDYFHSTSLPIVHS